MFYIVQILMALMLLLGSAWGQDNIDPRPGCDSCRFRIDRLEQPFDLRGMWLFTREDRPENKEPGLDTRDWTLLKTPGPWRNAYGDGQNYRVGWYRATLAFAPSLVGQEVVLLFDSHISRTQVYLDGGLVFERPTDANTGRNFHLQSIPVRFTVTQPWHVVAIRIDTPLMQGMFQLPFELRRYVANAPDLAWHQWRGSELQQNSAVIGVAFGLFLLLLYSKTRYGLYLHAALASLFCSVYLLATNDFVLRQITPDTAFILSYFGLNFVYFLYRFAQYFYQPMPRLNRCLGALLLCSSLALASMLVWPNLDWLQTLRTLHFLLADALGVLSLYATAQGLRQRRRGAGILLVGFVVFLGCGLNDMLLGLGFIGSYFMIPLGLLTMLAAMLYVTGSTMARTFSDNKKLLISLQTSNDKISTIYNAIPDMVAVTRFHDGVIIEVNDATVRIYGLPREQIIGRTFENTDFWDDPADYRRFVALLLAQGKVDAFECTTRNHAGLRFRSSLSAHPFEFGSQTHVLLMSRDITDLRRSHDMMAKMQHNAGIGIWRWNVADDEILLSQNSMDLLQRDFDNSGTMPPGFAVRIKGTDSMNFVHPDDWPYYLGTISAVMHSRQPGSMRCRMLRGDGSELLMLTELDIEVDVQGEVQFVYGFTRDITEEQRTEALRTAIAVAEAAQHAAEVANRMKSEFLAMISHEIRTPLGGVIGMLKLGLKDNRLTPDTRGKFHVGLNSAESLLQIINDILDYSKLEAGKMTLERIDFDLPAVVQDAHSILQERAQDRGLAFSVQVPADLPRWWQGDPVRLRQVLINLMGNAIKFTEHGSVKVYVQQVPDSWLEFSVVDTGIGIAPEALSRLFQKFEQADASTTRKFGGTGLGLAICKSIVEAMGGTIGVTSTPGVGTTFHFRLPLPEGHQPQTLAASANQQHTHRLAILCAEDGKTNQIIVRELVEGLGHAIDIAEDGLAALHALAAKDYDLVLMDSRMPTMDGLQALHLLRQGAQGVRDATLPVIALTANVGLEERERFFAAGADGFLGKPIDEAALQAELARMIALLLARGKALPEQPETPGIAALDALFGLDAGPLETPAPSGFSRDARTAMQTAFASEAPRLLGVIEDAVATASPHAVALAAHSLKGSAGYFGATELQELCRQIEHLADAGDLAGVAALLAELQRTVTGAISDIIA